MRSRGHERVVQLTVRPTSECATNYFKDQACAPMERRPFRGFQCMAVVHISVRWIRAALWVIHGTHCRVGLYATRKGIRRCGREKGVLSFFSLCLSFLSTATAATATATLGVGRFSCALDNKGISSILVKDFQNYPTCLSNPFPRRINRPSYTRGGPRANTAE